MPDPPPELEAVAEALYEAHTARLGEGQPPWGRADEDVRCCYLRDARTALAASSQPVSGGPGSPGERPDPRDRVIVEMRAAADRMDLDYGEMLRAWADRLDAALSAGPAGPSREQPADEIVGMSSSADGGWGVEVRVFRDDEPDDEQRAAISRALSVAMDAAFAVLVPADGEERRLELLEEAARAEAAGDVEHAADRRAAAREWPVLTSAEADHLLGFLEPGEDGPLAEKLAAYRDQGASG